MISFDLDQNGMTGLMLACQTTGIPAPNWMPDLSYQTFIAVQAHFDRKHNAF
jgi:hypothetical protein